MSEDFTAKITIYHGRVTTDIIDVTVNAAAFSEAFGKVEDHFAWDETATTIAISLRKVSRIE